MTHVGMTRSLLEARGIEAMIEATRLGLYGAGHVPAYPHYITLAVGFQYWPIKRISPARAPYTEATVEYSI
jgi:hypothetical protein